MYSGFSKTWWTRYRFWKVNQLTLDWWLWLQTIWWRWIRIKTFSTPKRKSKLQQLTEWSINWLQFIGLPLLEIMLCWQCTPIKLICVKHSSMIWLAASKNIMIKITEIWLLQVNVFLVCNIFQIFFPNALWKRTLQLYSRLVLCTVFPY